ncbi:MAG: LacI family DNA-binding transcriptional regulator [Candidatus Choladocola sp.]|nr:LacI family DNA-binding transcriptional regulator [Candidatus Choladocola sp.]
MVSLKDISEVCKVSVATVSKALNNQSDISEKTKARIQKTAKEMGYYPNSAAKALKTNRTWNLGVLFSDEAQSGLTHDYFANVLNSFKRTAEQKGYDITFINCCKTRENKMTYLEHAKYRGFDGVVIACIDFDDPEVVELVNSKIPVVTIDHVFNNTTAIVSDNIKGMRDLVNSIMEKGHTKIAYIHGSDSAVTKNRLTSFYKTTQEAGLQISDDYVREAAYRNVEEACEKTRELLALEEPPTCILYPDDVAGFGGIKAIKEAGYRIPQDISIAGYDGIRFGQYLTPPLTTLEQDTEQIGMEAANELIQLIENPKITGIHRVVVEGKVRPGGTVKQL